MTVEVNRKTWSQFCKKFNLTNQYRSAQVSVKQKGRRKIEMVPEAPFLGVSISKKGRLIDGIDLFTGQLDPDRLNQPLVSIKQPESILVEKDKTGEATRLSVTSKDGTEAAVILTGEAGESRYRSFVEQIAYSLYERRGGSQGDHIDDWLEAEKRVRATEQSLTR